MLRLRHVDPFDYLFPRAACRASSTTDCDAPRADFRPPVDIVEQDDAVYLRADLPGLERDDVHIEVEKNVLYLHGERKAPEGGEALRAERPHGTFQRRFHLPDTVDVEGIAASFEAGVLEVKLPRAATAKPVQIAIN